MAEHDLPPDQRDDRPEPGDASSAAGRDQAPLPWKTVAKHAVSIVVAGLTLYLLFPKILQILSTWPRLSTLRPGWLAAGVIAEAASFGCTFALKRLALRTRRWGPVITAALCGNAVTNIFPGGDAAGAAVEYRLLGESGIDPATAVGGLTAFSLLQVGSLLALPIFSLPAILFGAPVRKGLAHAAYVGIGAFVLFAVCGTILMSRDRPLVVAGRVVQHVWNRLRPHAQVTGLDQKLLQQRDSIRSVLGQKWWQAVLLCAGRLGFDFLALLAMLSATGANPRPSLVLLAYSIATIIALVPLTPGGLGLVEASLSGLLVLSGVRSGAAYLATLAYRLASYWIPVAAGPVAYLVFRQHHKTPGTPAVRTPGHRP